MDTTYRYDNPEQEKAYNEGYEAGYTAGHHAGYASSFIEANRMKANEAYNEGYRRGLDSLEPNDRVLAAILRTKVYLGDYWEKTLKGRLKSTGSGSRFNTDDPTEIEKMLTSASWVPYPEVQHLLLEGCEAFKADIPGVLGVVKIEDLPECAEILLVDRKKTGFLSAEVGGFAFVNQLTAVAHTTIILGQEAGHEVVFTVHPGDPVRPSQLKGYPRTIHRDEAIALGLKYAKVM